MPHASPDSRPRSRSGFTLIEIMVVVAIIGLLATLVAPNVIKYLRQSKVTVTEAKMKNLRQPIQQYYMHYSRVPDSLEDLLQPDDKNLGEAYIESREEITDAWGNEFSYERLSNNKYDIISYGADGVEGGEADDKDLHSNEASAGGS